MMELWQTISASAAGIGFAGATAYFSPWLWRQRRMSLVREHLSANRMLALTYDDGPSSGMTPQLLDLLRCREARATFFMLGRHARQHPEIADRIRREGHDVGCHTYDHLNAWKISPWSAVADIRAGYDQLSAWVSASGMFRPPHGKMTLPTYLSVRRRGAPVWWWTLDSGDTHNRLPAVHEISDALRRDQGGIVLMHDLDRGKERNDFVLQMTDALLDVAMQESLKIVPLSEVCQ